MELYYGEMESPLGVMTIVSDGKAVVRIDFGTFAELETKYKKWGNRYFDQPVLIQDSKAVEHVRAEILDYLQGNRRRFSFDFEFHGTPFQESVWQALLGISYGQTKTYKDIAHAINNPKAVRAVGGAVNKNPFSIVVPCHRVIGANGDMVGYGGGLDKKEFLLAHEAK